MTMPMTPATSAKPAPAGPLPAGTAAAHPPEFDGPLPVSPSLPPLAEFPVLLPE
jgi:hypothetical protein